jgi:hypothetical protein
MNGMRSQSIGNPEDTDLYTDNRARWRCFTDAVMGGASVGTLADAEIAGRSCLHLTGMVSLDNNGGFIQASVDLSESGCFDASAYQGVEIDIYGNGETYNLHLRTLDTHLVWQSYRASFQTQARWQRVRLAFSDFTPHRITTPLNKSRLRRVGVVAIGRVMQADIAIANLGFY